MSEEHIKVPVKTSYRTYLYGDFDRDNTKNIDDPEPFNKHVSKYPDPTKNPEYYHETRYGGYETKMSDVLLNLENDLNKRSPGLKKFIHENPKSYGRIKTIPSVIEKLHKQGLGDIHDVAGATLIEKDRKQVYQRANQIKQKYKTNPQRNDDFYKSPKHDVYYGYHVEVLNPFPLEVQIKSEPMEKMHKQMHESYKKGMPMHSFKSKTRRLYDLGY